MREENTRLHILIVPSWYEEREDRSGGLFFHQMAKYLAASGMKIDLLHAHLKPFGPLIPRTGVMEMNGFRIWSKRSFAWPKRWEWARRRWIHQFSDWMENYRREEGKPDIIHAHGYEAASVANVVSRNWGVPVVYTEHLSRVLTRNLKAHQKILYNEAGQDADRVTAVSGGMTDRMQKDLGRDVMTIPNMIDTEFFYPKSTIPDTPVFLSIGDPWRIKGLDLLIEAVGQLEEDIPNIRLRLADRIPDRKSLQKIINRYGIDEQVHFLGRLSPEEVREEIHAASALVSASRVESFGMTMAEAISCGTPVLASPTAGAREIMDAKTGIVLEDLDVERLVKGLRDILQFSYTASELHEYARKHFDRRVLCDRWRALYEDLLYIKTSRS